MESKVKNYWDERAGLNQNAVTGTTDDVYLRELEIRTFSDMLKACGITKESKILDVGCGDGYTTLNVAKHFPGTSFTGIDYSENMIKNANKNLANTAEVGSHVAFKVADATKLSETFTPGTFDFILSDRCLINLETKENQYAAIAQIGKLLRNGGTYIAIENFMEGQKNLTDARLKMGLNEIPVRWHNLFFEETEFRKNAAASFKSVEIIEFSSSYYFATRVVYSAMCKLRNEQPDYLHDIHKISVDLPVNGCFSPIRLVVLKK